MKYIRLNFNYYFEEPEESDNSTPEGPIENEQSVSDAVIGE